MNFWFFPVKSGDFRLTRTGDFSCTLDVEEPTLEEINLLESVLEKSLERKWIEKMVDVDPKKIDTKDESLWAYVRRTLKIRSKHKTKVAINAPIHELGPLLAGKTHGDAKLWTLVRSKSGVITVEDGAKVSEPAKTEAAATVKEPKKGCPEPTACERRASEVLRTFSTASQFAQFQAEGRMKAIGCVSGRAYHVYHRDEAAARGLYRSLTDAATERPICVWDDTVAPEEEMLSLKAMVEHREAWLLGQAMGHGERHLLA